MTQVMSPVDSVWLQLESSDTPMHFGAVFIFAPPASARPGHVGRLYEQMATVDGVQPPWNLRLPHAPGARFQPMLVVENRFDLREHFHHTVLEPGGDASLHELMARLHGEQLDLRRPLWQCHLVEGLDNGRYALYFKIHHALLDGTSALRLLVAMFSSQKSDRQVLPAWVRQSGADSPQPGILARAAQLGGRMVGAPRTLLQATRLGARTALAATGLDRSLTMPYRAPRSMLTRNVTSRREYAIEELELALVKRAAKAAGCTINDLILYMTGTALRRFLIERDALPERSLTVSAPVNVRRSGDERVGNAVTQIYVNLGTDIADPGARLEKVRSSVTEAKKHLRLMPHGTEGQYLMAVASPYALSMIAGLRSRGPVPYSLSVSNVPGPPEPLYLAGARLESVFPLAALMHGGTLLIICTSYAGKLIISATAAADPLPDVELIALYMRDALEELRKHQDELPE